MTKLIVGAGDRMDHWLGSLIGWMFKVLLVTIGMGATVFTRFGTAHAFGTATIPEKAT